jgi:alpha-glucosidase
MLGDCILVAPVLDPGETQVKVFIPKISSSWTYIWSFQVFDFGWTVVDAPLGRPGIFIKSSELKRKTLLPFINFCQSFDG